MSANKFYVFFSCINTDGLMPIKRKILFVIIALLVINQSLQAQLSRGGSPLNVISTKSSVKSFVEMPSLSREDIQKEMNVTDADDLPLKSLRFAHPFEVNLNTTNAGQWYETNAGYNVWKLNIYSEGAKSLNLIFDRFKLPEGARLFLYNEVEDIYLGAFTSDNNKASGKLAVSPVIGDEITVQYEVPVSLGTPNDFEIIRVNHDFIGIEKSDRRPMGITAGDCNVDINCSIAEPYRELRNSACRLIVDGIEICSGTLVNNTAQDGTPYILSAAHCYDAWNLAEVTVYTFNYESPYCAPLDGDPSNSISGAIMKATHDSLDFALVELSEVPPPSFRPYYAGWSHATSLPDSTVSIHHPQGDIKKIAFDNDPPKRSSFRSEYTPNAFLNIKEWDEGVTEAGSSGGGLFNSKNQLIGTLTGGAALCGSPYNDYYGSFSVYWDYRSDSTKQVKHWLDPINSGEVAIDAKQFYADENLCEAFTNLNDNDEHANIRILSNGSFAGYWGGSNSVGISEIVEKFSISGDESLKGVSLGVGKIVRRASGASNIAVNVYSGETMPEDLLYSKNVNITNLVADAMNYIEFDEDVLPAGNFFVGFDLNSVQSIDTVVVYQSLRESGEENNFYYKLNGSWSDFEDNEQGAICNVMEVVACNYDEITNDTQNVELPVNVWVYPNPTNSELVIESDQTITVETISVFNLIGQEINVPLLGVSSNRVELDLSGNTPGIYVVRFNYNDSYVTRKFSLVSN